jgi:hypothetical protein
MRDELGWRVVDKQAEQGQRIANACFITGDSE